MTDIPEMQADEIDVWAGFGGFLLQAADLLDEIVDCWGGDKLKTKLDDRKQDGGDLCDAYDALVRDMRDWLDDVWKEFEAVNEETRKLMPLVSAYKGYPFYAEILKSVGILQTVQGLNRSAELTFHISLSFWHYGKFYNGVDYRQHKRQKTLWLAKEQGIERTNDYFGQDISDFYHAKEELTELDYQAAIRTISEYCNSIIGQNYSQNLKSVADTIVGYLSAMSPTVPISELFPYKSPVCFFTEMRLKRNQSLSAPETGASGDAWDNPAYITATEAVKLSEGKISLSQLSKLVSAGEIEGVRKGQRCKVNIQSLRDHLKTLGGDAFSEQAFERYFAGAEQRQTAIRERKKPKQ